MGGARYFTINFGGSLRSRTLSPQMVAWTITESEFHSAQSIFQANLPCHITWNGATTTKKTQGKRILVRTPKNSRRRAPTRGGGHPQGAPLPIVFSRRYALGEGIHKGRPYRLSSLGVMPLGRASTGGAPTDCLLSALCLGEGTHKGCPYQLFSLGVMPWGGHPQGRPYQLSSLGAMPWGGRPQGAPLPIRYALGRAPTRGAPTSTDCLLSALCPGEGTHKGCPYQFSSLGVLPWGGRPLGAPLPIVFSRRYALGRAPTRGAPTNCLLSALCPGEGTHKGRPYRLSSLGVMPWGGHPQGVPLPIRYALGRAPLGVPLPIRYALGRAPTRGAPTNSLGRASPTDCRRFALGRAPTRGAPTDCLLWTLCSEEGTHKGRPYRLSSLGVMF